MICEKQLKMKKLIWITPFHCQCFVSFGVALNMMQIGLVIGFAVVLLPQLRVSTSAIPMDDNYGSWIASLPGLSVIVGNITVPSIMGKFGRKSAYLVALVITVVGWCSVLLSSDINLLLAARFVQGVGIGITSTLGPVLVGEYTSPINRGAFLMTLSLMIGFGVLLSHTMGSYLTWQTSCIICIGITVLNMVIAFFSPESPIWLADQCRFDECKAIYRWLRGDTEEDELNKMIAANQARKETKDNELGTETFKVKIVKTFKGLGQTIMQGAFYKPIVIMIHFYAMSQWSGINMLASYITDLIHVMVGDDINVPLLMLSLNIQRIFSTAIALLFIKKLKRKTIMYITVGLNIAALIATAGYSYARTNNLLVYDSSYIGVALFHLHVVSIGTGPLPLSFIIAGEIFPLEFKSFAGGFSTLFFCFNLFVSLKTAPVMLYSLSLYGTYLVYAALMLYCLIVIGALLPETKDRTLQDIEDEFRGKKDTKTVPEKFTSRPNE